MKEEPRIRISEFERELFTRLSDFEQYQVLVLLEAGIADNVRAALAEIREYRERRGE